MRTVMRTLMFCLVLAGTSKIANGMQTRAPLPIQGTAEILIKPPSCNCKLEVDGSSNTGLDFGTEQIPSTGDPAVTRTIHFDDPDAVRLFATRKNCDGNWGYDATIKTQFPGSGVSFEVLDRHTISVARDTLRASVGAKVTIESTAIPDEDGIEEGEINVNVTCG